MKKVIWTAILMMILLIVVIFNSPYHVSAVGPRGDRPGGTDNAIQYRQDQRTLGGSTRCSRDVTTDGINCTCNPVTEDCYEIKSQETAQVDEPGTPGEVKWGFHNSGTEVPLCWFPNGGSRICLYDRFECFPVENLAAADDNVEFFIARIASLIVSVGCHCNGLCTTPAQISLEDRSGNAMTHGTVTCSTGTTNTTFVSVTANNNLVAGEGLRLDVDNAVAPESDQYVICHSYREQ